MLSAQSNGGKCRTESELRWLPRSFLLISKYLWLPEKVSKERSRDPCSCGISRHLCILVHKAGKERRQEAQSGQRDFQEGVWLERVKTWGWMMELDQNTAWADVRQVYRHQGGSWPHRGTSWRAGENSAADRTIWTLGENTRAWLLHFEISGIARAGICLMKVDDGDDGDDDE